MITSTLPDTARRDPRFATIGVAAIAALGSVALLAVLDRYGYFGDELYFLAAGRRLTASYADQGPLVPLIAHVIDTIAPGSLCALRLPAVVATAAAIVVTALIARELGGNRAAQLLAATGYATSPFLLVQGSQLATNTIDVALWVMITWLLVRWTRNRRDSLLIWAALVTATALQVKWLIPTLWLTMAVAAVAVGPRELLRRRALWLGAAIVVATALPSIWWQHRNGWPQLSMGGVVAAENEFVGGRLLFIPSAMFVAGLLGSVLLVCGVWALLRSEPLRNYRFLGVTVLLLFAVFIALGGRPYYVAGVYSVAMAAGAVWLTRDTQRWQRVVAVPLIGASVALALWSLPWQPESDIPPAPDSPSISILLYGRFGWPDLGAATAQAYRALTPDEQTHAVIIANSYWQASALDNYRDGYLPAVYSPSRGWGYFGAPPDSATTALFVDRRPDTAKTLCAHVQPVGRVDARLGYPGVTRDVTIWKCTDPLLPWSRVWPSLLRLG
ncbi:hypothetical protein M2272_004523 [Mycobacterium frederiksbergense]|uniref:Glycosyltransferase RgtA/B/C/D-like domain-containing protein n=1 Tax=Mycolicibacterium frederiksbergense TaxID=117567 RepID=A0ABT6L6M5_9MYCO|nr:glycosyltransferase family 39 protein [Mycolicibacterium frederiksbergense]MDH6197867.1 hypothetical protein [Mycolicibacterium frederiksbergense]